ncbi:LuxR C-terminal-related transcriptional regulator [Hymenobacter sp. BT175]|uniref:helix-turn-helix domain-containing protein n=1 Tax=Hymenobacter translucens TaxID=2886507 RepID=UPI001D0EE519|nr:helix-turn-helix transcriptional regulator [Hymenobacter translucens]MCC2546474.1 LuxR C-terminal-related transcriptional regulator [Hymenobacter translucens]
MTDEERITAKIAEIAATADQYPAVIIIHHVPTQTVRYLSKWGLELLGATIEELTALGPAFSPTYFNPVESDEYMARVFQLMYENEVPEVHTFYQQVRTTEREGWSWYLTSMRRLLTDEQGGPLLVMGLAIPLHPDNHFAAKVRRLIDENDFLRRHRMAFSSLTARERDVLRLLALGHSAPEIARELNISELTAGTHRRNVRQKLGATTAFDLTEYARAFDLI